MDVTKKQVEVSKEKLIHYSNMRDILVKLTKKETMESELLKDVLKILDLLALSFTDLNVETDDVSNEIYEILS